MRTFIKIINIQSESSGKKNQKKKNKFNFLLFLIYNTDGLSIDWYICLLRNYFVFIVEKKCIVHIYYRVKIQPIAILAIKSIFQCTVWLFFVVKKKKTIKRNLKMKNALIFCIFVWWSIYIVFNANCLNFLFLLLQSDVIFFEKYENYKYWSCNMNNIFLL